MPLSFWPWRTVFLGTCGPDLMLGNLPIPTVLFAAMIPHLVCFLFLYPLPLSYLPSSMAILWSFASSEIVLFPSLCFLSVYLILPTPLSPTSRMLMINKGSQFHQGKWWACVLGSSYNPQGAERMRRKQKLSPLEHLLLGRSFSLFLSKIYAALVYEKKSKATGGNQKSLGCREQLGSTGHSFMR